MIVLQLVVWLVFGAVSFLVVCYLHSVYHFGNWLDALFFQAQAPHGMGRALCARGGAAPLSPEGFLLHIPERQ